MARLTLLGAVSLWAADLPGAVGRGGGGRGRRNAKFIEFPCEWIKSLEEAAKKTDSKRTLLYLFFHRPAPKLDGNFHINEEMQKISKEVMVFVDITVPKKPEKEQLALLKRCKVSRLSRAVITDKYGNLLYVNASSKDPKTLKKQAVLAERVAKKREEDLAETLEKARGYFKEEKYSGAAATLAKVLGGDLTGLPVLEAMSGLFGEIDDHFAAELRAIEKEKLDPDEKKKRLASLKSQAHKDLPVYKLIVAAYEKAASG